MAAWCRAGGGHIGAFRFGGGEVGAFGLVGGAVLAVLVGGAVLGVLVGGAVLGVFGMTRSTRSSWISITTAGTAN